MINLGLLYPSSSSIDTSTFSVTVKTDKGTYVFPEILETILRQEQEMKRLPIGKQVYRQLVGLAIDYNKRNIAGWEYQEICNP